MIKIIKAKDYNEMSRKAANIISAQVIMKPDCVLGLATGSSPLGIYAQLIDWYKKGDLDFSQTKSVNLDEYRGLSHANPQSYYYFMNENFFKHININPANTHVPNGMELDAQNIVKEAFFGPVIPQVPASILQMHPDVTLVADADALSKCTPLI